MGYGKIIAFVGGAAVTGLAQYVSKQPAVRKAAVNAVARGMQVKADADEALQNIKDDAEDLCADARQQAKIDAAVEARKAEIEARVRAEVEAELAAEEAAAAKAAAKAKPAKGKAE